MKVIAAHNYVNNFIKFKSDSINMVLGKCLDETVTQMNYYSYKSEFSRNISLKAMKSFAFMLNSELIKNNIVLNNADKKIYYAMGWRFINAFKKSEVYKNNLLRDKTRLIIINNSAGIYAQPDFVDYYNEIMYEMKSFSLKPIPEYVKIQVKIFQLAYPDFESKLIAFPRDQDYIKTQIITVKKQAERTKKSLLKKLYKFTMDNGNDIDSETAIGNRKYINYNL